MIILNIEKNGKVNLSITFRTLKEAKVFRKLYPSARIIVQFIRDDRHARS